MAARRALEWIEMFDGLACILDIKYLTISAIGVPNELCEIYINP